MAHAACASSVRCAGVCSTSYSVEPSMTRHQRYATVFTAADRCHHGCRPTQHSFTSLAATHTFGRLVLRRTRPVHFSYRPQLQIYCSKHDSRPSNSRRPRRGWPPWDWLQHLPSLPRLLFNVLAFCLLMRLWPLQGKSPLGDAQTVNLQVPFSTFVQQTNGKQVSAVTVDGLTLKYTLRENADLLQHLPESAQSVKVAFQTTRPADYAMPYEQLLKHGVQFGAVEARHNWMLTVMVSWRITQTNSHSCNTVNGCMLLQCT